MKDYEFPSLSVIAALSLLGTALLLPIIPPAQAQKACTGKWKTLERCYESCPRGFPKSSICKQDCDRCYKASAFPKSLLTNRLLSFCTWEAKSRATSSCEAPKVASCPGDDTLLPIRNWPI